MVSSLAQQIDQSQIIDDVYDSEIVTKPGHVLTCVRPQINQLQLIYDP